MNFEKFTVKAQEATLHAQQIAMSKQQQVIDNAHLLRGILATDEHTIPFLLKKCGVPVPELERRTDDLIQTFPQVSGANKIYLSADANKAIAQSLVLAEKNGDEFISVEVLLQGILSTNDRTARLLRELGATEKNLESAIQELRKGTAVQSQEAENTYQALQKYAVNLNQQARNGKLDPIIGRDEEIRRVLHILSRRKKNNPLLIGDPGVGKTAIVEGLAWRIVKQDVPENLKSKSIYTLDLAALVAGAKYKGEFEERLKAVIKEVEKSNGEIILFIDEIHTLIGAGGGSGAMDAANILKPALARGEVHAIGATTMDEYQKYFEKDKALDRRFQAVLVEQPSTADTLSILRGLREKYEVHHKVKILDSALVAAVELSNRYITNRFLPDKAIDLIDEAAAKLRLELDSMPEELDELDRKIRQLEVEREALKRDDDQAKVAAHTRQIAQLSEQLTELRARWQHERQLLNTAQQLRQQIEMLRVQADEARRNSDYAKVAEIEYGKIKEAERQLQQVQEQLDATDPNQRLTDEVVDADDIADVVARRTGIPVAKMVQSEREKLLQLEDQLGKRVIGQREAIRAVADAVRRSRAGLQDPNKPIGSFLFLGSTGVGKTELAKALAEALFDTERAIVRIDMSEYMEKHAVSRLVGAPPGYVGYDEGGQLTEAVRHHPYSIVLLDEIEKAHPDVFNILLQVLDDGHLTDNQGRVANFKNTIIIMTSNMGSELIMDNFDGLKQVSEAQRLQLIEATERQVLELLKQRLRPEFLNRIDDKIVFLPLTRDETRRIAQLMFAKVQQMLERQGLQSRITEAALDFLVHLGYDPQFGARPMKRAIQSEVVNVLSKHLLAGDFQPGDTVVIDNLGDGRISCYAEPRPAS